jgi:hypothetical protein
MSHEELLRELGELATSLGPAVRPAGTDELLGSLTETARRLFGAAACLLALLSEDESELLYTVAAGEEPEDVTGMRMSSSQGIAGWVVQSGQPIAISDVASDPRFSMEQAERTGYVPQTVLAVPVQTPQRMPGICSATALLVPGSSGALPPKRVGRGQARSATLASNAARRERSRRAPRDSNVLRAACNSP